MKKIRWNPSGLPQDLQTALTVLADEYPLTQGKKGDLTVTFKPITASQRTVNVNRKGEEVVIEYSDLAAALRGLGLVISRSSETKFSAGQQTSFNTFGIMLDCSRNAVIKVDHFCGWLRKLALLGYNMAMLYTEDTYQIPDEPYFGYQRGAYSADELKPIDAYARQLGIEMIPCIQTLGHLEQILKWHAYDQVKDTSSVLLVDEPKTYQLIEKMIKTYASCFSSKRIHIGMDETHDLGRGRFMDKFGYQRGFDIFNRHLAKVTDLCKKYKLDPMIWSDMYFRMGSKTMDYYDKDCVIPADVKAKIPADVQLVYWDYYHDNEAFYEDWIQRHRDLGKEPLMGSGVWTWGSFWYNRAQTEKTAGPCIRASLKAGLKEFFVTMWGDDGAYCDFDSAMGGLTWVAELAYTGKTDEKSLIKWFDGVCHSNYRENAIAGDILGWGLVWDDPILGIYWHNQSKIEPNAWKNALKKYANILTHMKKSKTKTTTGGDFEYALVLADFFHKKIDLQTRLQAAYPKRNKPALKAVVKDIPKLIAAIERLDKVFCTQWLRRNKPWGLEAIQVRLAGQIRRYRELDRRLRDLLAGKIDQIEEMENRPKAALEQINGNYRCLVTASSYA